MVKQILRNGDYEMWLPHEYDGRELLMIKELCTSLAGEVSDLMKIGFRLYMEEYDATHKQISWQAKLTSLPEIAQTCPDSLPIKTIAAQVQYDAVNHNNARENYHGTFSMAIQTLGVPAKREALLNGETWMIDNRAYSILRLAESQYRSAIKAYYHEWGTHYEDDLRFVKNEGVFMRELDVYPEFQKKDDDAQDFVNNTEALIREMSDNPKFQNSDQ